MNAAFYSSVGQVTGEAVPIAEEVGYLATQAHGIRSGAATGKNGSSSAGRQDDGGGDQAGRKFRGRHPESTH